MTETYRIRSVETWVQARDDYLAGMSAVAVCHRHDLGLSAFRRRARKYGWRRRDQADPAPTELDLSIYDDVRADEEVELARLRFVQALSHGRAVEAARWRRLWRQMRDELAEFDAEFFRGYTPEERAAVLADRDDDEDTPEEALLLAAPPLDLASEPSGPASPPAEKVHYVHSVFSEPD